MVKFSHGVTAKFVLELNVRKIDSNYKYKKYVQFTFLELRKLRFFQNGICTVLFYYRSNLN